MATRYSCFISYRAIRQPLAERFLRDFYEGLSSELAPLLDAEPFIDWERLQAGDQFSEHVARAICQSACMIVVYTPNYFSAVHTLTTREYVAMELLEERRSAELPGKKNAGLIIPVILRRAHNLPPRLSERPLYDFSSFLLSERSMTRNRAYRQLLRSIAERVAELNVKAADWPPHALDCGSFTLPTEDEIRPYLDEFAVAAKFPSMLQERQ